MKTKKPRSATTGKPAGRAHGRATRKRPTTPRRKAASAKVKRAKRTRPRKPTALVKRKPGLAAKPKRASKRVARKPRTRSSTVVKAARASRPGMPEPIAELGELPPPPHTHVTPAPTRPPTGPSQLSGPNLPAVLFEDDEPVAPPAAGPGQKYALGASASSGLAKPQEARLPEAYGTGKLLLAARDPHWLYVHWDLTSAQQRRYNALSADKHLVVRVYSGRIAGQPVTEVHIHPESRFWFVHVARAQTRYLAELGYYRPGRQWVPITTSAPAMTPPDSVSADPTVRFATIPASVPLAQLAALAKQAIPEDLPPLAAARERALAEMVALHADPCDAMSSAGIGERDFLAPFGGEAEGVSSPTGPVELPAEGFWFNVSADLVIYGATEPDASVTIDGRPVSLRADGTFNCRFSLPDGEHAVRVAALSAQGDLRQAELRFSRRTDYRGTAPQDQSPKPPGAGL